MFEQQLSQSNVFQENALRIRKALEHNIRNALLYEKDGPEKNAQIINVFHTFCIHSFPQQTDTITEAFKEIERMKISDENVLVSELSEKITNILSPHYSLQDIEKGFKPGFEHGDRMERINRMLDVEFAQEADTKYLRLHMPILFTQNPIELKKLFVEGLKIIAQKIKSEEKYKDSSGLVGYSTLIYEYPSIVENLGFIITSRDESKGAAEMTMRIDTLLHLYGTDIKE